MQRINDVEVTARCRASTAGASARCCVSQGEADLTREATGSISRGGRSAFAPIVGCCRGNGSRVSAYKALSKGSNCIGVIFGLYTSRRAILALRLLDDRSKTLLHESESFVCPTVGGSAMGKKFKTAERRPSGAHYLAMLATMPESVRGDAISRHEEWDGSFRRDGFVGSYCAGDDRDYTA